CQEILTGDLTNRIDVLTIHETEKLTGFRLFKHGINALGVGGDGFVRSPLPELRAVARDREEETPLGVEKITVVIRLKYPFEELACPFLLRFLIAEHHRAVRVVDAPGLSAMVSNRYRRATELRRVLSRLLSEGSQELT